MSVDEEMLTTGQKISLASKARFARRLEAIRQSEIESMRREMMLVYPATVFGECSLNEVLADIVAEFGITRGELVSKKRPRHIVFARQKAMYVLYQRGLSSPHIAKILGKMDHTTVLHGIKAHATRLKLLGAANGM